MLHYDTEAAPHDTLRAEAAAQCVLGLLPAGTGTLLDLGCGTGLVTQRYARPGLRILGVDSSPDMARTAAGRVGPTVALADCRRLPHPDRSLDAVSAVLLLHLLRDAAAVVSESARVLRPGGVFITTVDEDAAHDVGSDIDELLAPYRDPDPYDEAGDITAAAARNGLRPAGEAVFTGHGLGRSPLRTVQDIRDGRYVSAFAFTPSQAEEVTAALAALPGPDLPRTDPVYRLLSFSATG